MLSLMIKSNLTEPRAICRLFPFLFFFVILHTFFSFSSTDHEYLHKSQGSVTIHNVTSGTSSEFLSKATFVSNSTCICVLKQHKPQKDSNSNFLQTLAVLSAADVSSGLVKLSQQFSFIQHRIKSKLMITSCLLTANMLRSWATIARYGELIHFTVTWIQCIFNAPGVIHIVLCVFCPISCGGIHLQLHIHFMTWKLGKYPNYGRSNSCTYDNLMQSSWKRPSTCLRFACRIHYSTFLSKSMLVQQLKSKRYRESDAIFVFFDFISANFSHRTFLMKSSTFPGLL